MDRMSTGSGQGQGEIQAGIQRCELYLHVPRLTKILKLWDWATNVLTIYYSVCKDFVFVLLLVNNFQPDLGSALWVRYSMLTDLI